MSLYEGTMTVTMTRVMVSDDIINDDFSTSKIDPCGVSS